MLPSVPGTYVLRMRCVSARAIRIGQLGTLRLRPGYYVYVGSAFGSGGLRARIRHHRRKSRRPHWHVDYLRLHVWLEGVVYIRGARREHEWAQAIAAMPGTSLVLRGFGSSDCDCATHLYWFATLPLLAGLS